MRLFATQDTSVSRRLLFVIGSLMLLAGLLMSWFQREDDDQRSPEESGALAEKIHERLVADDDAPAEPSDFDRLVAGLDTAAAPTPLPQRLDQEDHDVFVDVTAEFLLWFFESIGYTAERVEAGDRVVVPPVVLMSIPKGWAEDRTVQYKKSLFYRATLPLILLENQVVLEEREQVVAYANGLRNRAPITPKDRDRLRALAVRYRVLDEDSPAAVDQAVIDELLRRVDMVPPSLALAQAAYESGYATSRFAYTGNALFGQWDWSENALVPRERREGLGRYGVRAFEHPIDSVRAYLWNLNTHNAYADFRRERARQRGGNEGQSVLDGHALAVTLLAYSERGAEYTREIQGMISYNDLRRADDLRLIEGDTIFFD